MAKRKHALDAAEVAQAVHAEIHKLGAVGEVIGHTLGRRARQGT
jgi:hypothetical protein